MLLPYHHDIAYLILECKDNAIRCGSWRSPKINMFMTLEKQKLPECRNFQCICVLYMYIVLTNTEFFWEGCRWDHWGTNKPLMLRLLETNRASFFVSQNEKLKD